LNQLRGKIATCRDLFASIGILRDPEQEIAEDLLSTVGSVALALSDLRASVSAGREALIGAQRSYLLAIQDLVSALKADEQPSTAEDLAVFAKATITCAARYAQSTSDGMYARAFSQRLAEQGILLKQISSEARQVLARV
jgi:hypothetical protein